nr:MAG TPA: hypothetical protein [Caudoviricetes sp.]
MIEMGLISHLLFFVKNCFQLYTIIMESYLKI